MSDAQATRAGSPWFAELDGEPVGVAELGALALANVGHFTTMRVEPPGLVRGLELHLDRLVTDCRTVFGVELDRERVRRLAARAVAGRAEPVVVRVTVFDPALDIGHPSAAAHPRVLVTVRAAPAGGAAAPAALPPLRLGTRRFRRDLPVVKHVGLFGPLFERSAAQRAGFDDAVFVDDESAITEGPTWNIGFFDGERVVWPDADVLPGVTMRLLQRSPLRLDQPAVAATAPISGHVTARVTLADVHRMEAAFVSNAANAVRPVAAIDDARFQPDHPVLAALAAAYAAISPTPL